MPSLTATVVLDAQAQLGEGAIWDATRNCLLWVDIEGQTLHLFDPATGHDRALPTGTRIGTVVPFTDTEVVVALQSGIHRMNTATGQLTLLVNPITEPTIRFNDGKCDPAGRLWVGTFDLNVRPGAASLYRLDPDGSLHTMMRNVTISNGLAWSPDQRTMYYIDSPTQAIQAFDYDHATGTITNGRILVEISRADGEPDGMTLDANGNLWVAIWGGSCVNCYHASTGALLQTVRIAAPHTSSCAFGGPDLKTLFITSARQGLSEAQLREFPLSGNVFAVQPGVAGVPANCYRVSDSKA